jgi:hypothetical protein
MVTVSDLDAKALEVLEAIYEAGGEASTTEIKEYTGFEKRGVIHYRYEKLREAGLIETETGDPEGTKIPPTIATLTEAAQKEIRGGLFGEEEGTIVERMDRIERRHKTVLEELKSVQRDFEQWRFDPERDEEISAMELTARLREVSEKAEQIEEIHEEVDSIEELEEQVRDVQFSLQSYRDTTDELDVERHGAPRGDRGRRSVRPRSTANVGGAGRSGWRVGDRRTWTRSGATSRTSRSRSKNSGRRSASWGTAWISWRSRSGTGTSRCRRALSGARLWWLFTGSDV